MARPRSRVLQLSDSSSENDDDDDARRHPPHSLDDETIDDISVEDDDDEEPPVIVCPPMQHMQHRPQQAVASTVHHAGSDQGNAGVGSFFESLFRRRGIYVEPRWLASCVREMEELHPGIRSFGEERQGEVVFGQLIVADFNAVGLGCLPNSFESLHATELAGPFVLQVDEISDIGCNLRDRYQERAATPSRCLKLSMTDGVQRVAGIEYRPIPALHGLSSAGLKICVRNVHVRRGVILLVPEIVEVLGGFVQSLEEARQRAVAEVNKPARGTRNRRGETEARPLVERAMAAAWPNTATDVNLAPAAVGLQFNVNGQMNIHRQSVAAVGQQVNVNGQSTGLRQPPPPASNLPSSAAQVQSAPAPLLSRVSGTTTHVQQASYVSTETRVNISAGQTAPGSARQTTVGASGRQTISVSSLQTKKTSMSEVKRRQSTLPWTQIPANEQVHQENSTQMPTRTLGHLSLESRNKSQRLAESTSTCEPTAAGAGVQTPMNLDSDEDELHLADSEAAPAQNYQTFGFVEAPFTYLALLKEKLNLELGSALIAGTIKCVLTGVKDFQFKGCDEFTLIVHVDDGSLITEAFIHHKVVQAMVGYSPKEVSAALASSNKQQSQEMKNCMKRFQAFLKKFEGLMDVEYDRSSAIPVIQQMILSDNTLDLSSLRKRVTEYSTLRQPGPSGDPALIDISSP